MTTPPPEAPPPLLTPTMEESRAINNASGDEEIRALAQQLLKAGQLGFDPATLLKGVVTEIDSEGSPPTISIQISGDTTTTVPGVRVMSHYSPVVGDTVLVAKQGADIVVLGHIADTSGSVDGSPEGNGWITATLSAGSHNGNSNGDVQYRRVLDNGSWKMQWRGGWNVSGTTIVSGLASEYCPSSLRSIVVARNATGANDVKVDFTTSGSATLIGTTTAPASASGSGDIGNGGGFSLGSHTHSIPFDGDADGGGADHNHFGVAQSGGGFSVSDHNHGFSGGSHSHTVTAPTWVSLNGVEYFL